MVYTPQVWADSPATTSPITAARLNTIEAGIEAASETVTAAVYRSRGSQFCDFTATNSGAIAPFVYSALSSGTSAMQAPTDPNHMGVLRLTSSTTTNSGGRVQCDVAAILLAAGDYFEAVFAIPVTTNTTIRVGFLDTTSSTDTTDGVYVEIVGTTASFKTANNNTRTTAGTTATVAATVWYRAEIEVISATDVRGRLYNSDTGAVVLAEQTITTNIPTASGRSTAFGIVATNTNTSATNVLDLDLLAYERKAGSERVR